MILEHEEEEKEVEEVEEEEEEELYLRVGGRKEPLPPPKERPHAMISYTKTHSI